MSPRRLRIVIVVPGFVVERDEPGMPAVVDLVERLADVHEVEVLALRHPPRRPSYRVAGARVHILGLGPGGGAAARARVLARGIWVVAAIHRRRPVDMVHGLWIDEPGAVATIAGRLIRRPVVASMMGGELARLPDIGYGAALGRGGRWTSAMTLRFADLVTAGSASGRDALARSRGPTRVALLPLGVDVSVFRPADAPVSPAPRILFAGALEPVKDSLAAIRVFGTVLAGRPEPLLDVVGDGRLRPAAADLAARLGIADRVVFHGQVPRRSMPDRYRAASLLLVTSRHEGQSMVACEAAASGIPVVGTPVGVLPDLGDGAITVPSGDEDGLARAVLAVLDDPARAASMGAAARAVAVARFDLDRTVQELLDAYATLVRPAPGHASRA